MIVYAFDNQQGLNALEYALKQIVGANLVFSGYTDVRKILKAVEQNDYDILFADLEIQNKSGMLLLGRIHSWYPRSNFIGVASKENCGDALTLHTLHASDYLLKPYQSERLKDSLNHLRFPITA